MYLCKYNLSRECKGKHKDCVYCILEDIKAEIEEDKKKAVNYALNTADLTERYAHLRMETAYAIALAVIDKHLGKDGENE